MSSTAHRVKAVALVVLAAAAAGCSTARERIESAQAIHAAGDPERAYALLAGDGLRDETRDGLLWRMEEGKIAQDAGRFVESGAALLDASRLADRFDLEWSSTTLGEELGSVIVNDRVRTFRGSQADRIQIESERILSALLAGDANGAMIAARRVLERQRDAEVEEAKRIEAAQREIDKRGGSAAVAAALAGQGIQLDEAYAPSLNPLASWLAALVQLSTGDGNDRQRGETSLRRALAMQPDNPTLLAQVERSPFDLAAEGSPQVVVLFGLGSAPAIEQITISLITPWLGLSTIPLPKLVPQPRPGSSLEVAGTGDAVRTQLLADIERIRTLDFNHRLPEIILRTVVMIAAKEAATFAASEPFRRRDSDGAVVGQVLVLVAASLYKAATNQVDLRTWRSLPAEYQIAQLPRPADGLVTVGLVRNGSATDAVSVALPDAPVVLLWARALGADRLFVRAVPLRATSAVPSSLPVAPIASTE